MCIRFRGHIVSFTVLSAHYSPGWSALQLAAPRRNMGRRSAFYLLIGICSMLRDSSGCALNPLVDRWVVNGARATIECSGLSSRKWWLVSDPCQLDSAVLMQDCVSTSHVCHLPNGTYMNMGYCTVCCTDESASELSSDTIHSCNTIRVCPVVDVMIPSLVATGGTLNLETVVTTKPAPPPNSITVHTTHGVGTNVTLPGKTDGVGHRIPNTLNNFSFFHSFSVPACAATGDVVEVIVNWSKVPRNRYCPGSVGEIVKNVHIVRVNVSNGDDSLCVTGLPGGTSAATSNPLGTMVPSPSPIGLTETGEHTFSTTKFKLDLVSVGIGVAAVVILLLLIVAVVAMAVCYRRCQWPKKSSDSSSLELTAHHLLKPTGTPATTPSGCEKRVLGSSSSQDTPATTPTESDNLLNGSAVSSSQRSCANPPPSSTISNFPSSQSDCSYLPVELTGPAMGEMIVEQPPPPTHHHHHHHHHQPPTALNPPLTLQVPPRIPPNTRSPLPLQHQSTSSRPTTRDPAYFTHGEAIYLSNNLNNISVQV